MSRARPIRLPNGETAWFDVTRNHEKATHDQLELLVSICDTELDDLLDENLTRGDVLIRLREALGQGDTIPADVLVRRTKFRAERQALPKCRLCKKEGDSTKHHYINKWILRELADYTRLWADRSKNCIPICIDCHQDLHSRSNGPMSIASVLTDKERRFADAALTALAEERPKLLILIARGDDSVYEARLVKDWIAGLFNVKESAVNEPLMTDKPHLLRAVA